MEIRKDAGLLTLTHSEQLSQIDTIKLVIKIVNAFKPRSEQVWGRQLAFLSAMIYLYTRYNIVDYTNPIAQSVYMEHGFSPANVRTTAALLAKKGWIDMDSTLLKGHISCLAVDRRRLKIEINAYQEDEEYYSERAENSLDERSLRV